MSGGGQEPVIRHQLSSAIAANVIRNEEEDPERQPLIRQNSRNLNRERFQHNQRTAAQGVVHRTIVQRSTWLVLAVFILIFLFFMVWCVFYFQGWRTWWYYRDKPCDKHLANVLLSMQIMPLFSIVVECFGCRKMRLPAMIVTIIVLIVGFHSFYVSETCVKTNPELYGFLRHYLIFLAIWWITFITVPSVCMIVVVYGMMHGWFDEINGASPDTIKNIDTIAFDPSLFAEEGSPCDDKPAAECCVCTEAFDNNREIKRTSCHHYFHEECLGNWLRYATTCPLCRTNLDKSISDEDSQSAAAPAAGRFMTEGEELQQLRELAPYLEVDDETALSAIRNVGSVEAAACILGGGP